MSDEIVAASEILQSAVDDKAAAAIEAAQQHAADAQATAQAITDAALQTELGRQIETMRTENMTWKASLENQISQVSSQMSEIRNRLEAPPTAVVVQPSSTPEPLETVVAEKPQETLITPGVVNADGPEVLEEPENRKSRTGKRRII